MRRGSVSILVLTSLIALALPGEIHAEPAVTAVPFAVVTGHATWVDLQAPAAAPAATYTAAEDAALRDALADRLAESWETYQAECLVWFSGYNVNVRPSWDGSGANDFPSDADQGPAPDAAPNHDAAYEDHDFDDDVTNCLPEQDDTPTAPATALPNDHAVLAGHHGGTGSAFVLATERGDCDPVFGTDFAFRAHLDFVDPNDFYHEVMEMAYTCPDGQREQLWMGLIHQQTYDPTLEAVYTFALVVDTCDAQNLHAMSAAERPAAMRDEGLCTSGSPDSFDDTVRGRLRHDAVPATAEARAAGNAYDLDPGSHTFGTHRTNCRNNLVSWIVSDTEPASPVGADCLGEDHLVANVDVRVYDTDPTGLWQANSNGMTGWNSYAGPGPISRDVDPHPGLPAPVLDVVSVPVQECTAGGAEIVLDGSGSHDPSGYDLTYAWRSTELEVEAPEAAVSDAWAPLGTNTVTFTVSNPYKSTSTTFDVTVLDTRAPSVAVVKPLWYWHLYVADIVEVEHEAIPGGWAVGPFTAEVEAHDQCFGTPAHVTIESSLGDFVEFHGEGPYELLVDPPLGSYGTVSIRATGVDDLGHEGRDSSFVWAVGTGV